MYVCESHSVVSDSATPWTVVCQALHPWTFPGKNTGVGFHFLLQGIFWPRAWTQVSTLQADFFPSEPSGKPSLVPCVEVYANDEKHSHYQSSWSLGSWADWQWCAVLDPTWWRWTVSGNCFFDCIAVSDTMASSPLDCLLFVLGKQWSFYFSYSKLTWHNFMDILYENSDIWNVNFFHMTLMETLWSLCQPTLCLPNLFHSINCEYP